MYNSPLCKATPGHKHRVNFNARVTSDGYFLVCVSDRQLRVRVITFFPGEFTLLYILEAETLSPVSNDIQVKTKPVTYVFHYVWVTLRGGNIDNRGWAGISLTHDQSFNEEQLMDALLFNERATLLFYFGREPPPTHPPPSRSTTFQLFFNICQVIFLSAIENARLQLRYIAKRWCCLTLAARTRQNYPAFICKIPLFKGNNFSQWSLE